MISAKVFEALSQIEEEIRASAPIDSRPLLGVWFDNNRPLLQLVASELADTQTEANVLVQVERQLTRAAAEQAPLVEAFFRDNQALLSLVASRLLRAAPADVSSAPESRRASEREEANLAAISLLASGKSLGAEDRAILAGYSGWGGLSIDRVAARVPPGYLPEIQGLANEYYTPVRLTREAARLVGPLLTELRQANPEPLEALEPAAGIGRFLAGFQGEPLRWTACEFSRISAQILSALYPSATVFQGPFEKWVVENESEWAGRFHLVVSNPPYGRRGSTRNLDKKPGYQQGQAYLYFLHRGLDLLAPSGIGVFLIPYGFLTGRGSEYEAGRSSVLRRHHLLGAVRLPSELFPGGNIVTDLLFFQARGGELASPLPEDQAIIEGRYFEVHPELILGREIRGDDQDPSDGKRARRGYEVLGKFEGLPAIPFRPRCMGCTLRPYLVATQAKRNGPQRAELPVWLQEAAGLGERVQSFLSALAAQDEDSQRTAASLYVELREALLAFQAGLSVASGQRPFRFDQDPEFVRATKLFPELLSFLAAWNPNGTLATSFVAPPRYEPRFRGSWDDLPGIANWLYETERRVDLARILDVRAQLGKDRLLAKEVIEAQLASAGFAVDDGVWYPEGVYYAGDLWPKYDRAKARAEGGDALAKRQATRLLQTIGTPSFEELGVEPRAGYLPATVLREWIASFAEAKVDDLERRDGLLAFVDKSLQALHRAAPRTKWTLGYLNHDLSLFSPEASPRYLEQEKREETSQEALSRARLEFHEAAKRHFTEWIGARPDFQRSIEVSYARQARGFVHPSYPPTDLQIARWRGPIKLRPHQLSGAWRLVRNFGGLLAFDVGVGKTPTGIAAIARLRQEGKARRPLVVVPNSILYKWKKEFSRALPDYRVGVIGAELYRGRDGVLRSRPDTPQERVLKYRKFQAGEWDCALVAYSVFARNTLSRATVGKYVSVTPQIQRSLGLRARDQLRALQNQAKRPRRSKKEEAAKLASVAMVRKLLGDDSLKDATPDEVVELRAKVGAQIQRQKELRQEQLEDLLQRLQSVPERERAVFQLRLEEWIDQHAELPGGDPGLAWEDLGVDLLVVDEAQNFKNLTPVAEREGGIPKYLGAISEGSRRAWDLALRAFQVRDRNRGGGVILLSATPAKNSPLEYYSLISFIDSSAWLRVGISDAEQFIDRYLRLEVREVMQPDLRVKRQSVVAGFVRLNELRDTLFRFAEFRTAEEVGLKLPETRREQIEVPMADEQREMFADLAKRYTFALLRASADPGARFAALGLLQRMALVSLHPELVEGAPPIVGALAESGTEPTDASEDSEDGEIESESEEQPAVEPEKTEETEAKRVPWTWRNASRAKSYSSPKLDEAVKQILANPGCGHIVFADSTAVHYWLRALLKQAGIAEERIGVINGEVTPSALARQQIAERFNGVPPVLNARGQVEQEGEAPTIDVVIANATAYEGIDLQVRTCQVIHLDLPWEPATLQQRNGRAVRQGNSQAVIRIVYLISQRSNDAVRLDMIQGKLGWMGSVLDGGVRETNNPAAQVDLSPLELMLLGSDDPEAGRRAIEQLKQERAAETQRQVVDAAWQVLGGLASRVRSVRKLRDPEELAHTNQLLDEGVRRLQQLPSHVWPWHFHLDAVIRRAALAVSQEARIAVSEGQRLNRVDHNQRIVFGFEVGAIDETGTGFFARPFLGIEWFRLNVADLLAADKLPRPSHGALWDGSPPTPEDYSQQYARVEWSTLDKDQQRLLFRKLLDERRDRFLEHLKWEGAPDAFRARLWELEAPAVRLILLEPQSGATALLPVESEGRVKLVSAGSALKGAELLPWTEHGYQELLAGLAARRADGDIWAEHSFSDWRETVRRWWQRELPRGSGASAAQGNSGGTP